MGIVQRLVLLLAILVLPLAAAEEPEDAAAVWERQGLAGVATIDVAPRLPAAGQQFVATLTLQDAPEVSNITYQMCDVGSSCFVLGFPVEPVGENQWRLNTADEWKHSRQMSQGDTRHFDAGQRIGWQYTVNFADGSSAIFPDAPPCDPYAHENVASWKACEEGHYFAIDIAEAKSTPLPLLPATGLVILATAILRRRHD